LHDVPFNPVSTVASKFFSTPLFSSAAVATSLYKSQS
jgi:hypothetical protein